MYTRVGECCYCGAPIYMMLMWMAMVLPPSCPSCSCVVRRDVTYTNQVIRAVHPIIHMMEEQSYARD